MTKVTYHQLLDLLIDKVPEGSLTTYGELSKMFYGNTGAAQAVVAMLKAIVSENGSNSCDTNRVVGKSGMLVDVNGQLAQLVKEGVEVESKKANMQTCNVVRFDKSAC